MHQIEDWDIIQISARAGKYGDWMDLVYKLTTEFTEENPDQGISSSDINHMVYNYVRSL
jgi:hypothetical protein